MTNPGRYLVLVPPIEGATASNNGCAVCMTTNPGDKFTAWDATVTFDYMPRQWLTFRWEADYRYGAQVSRDEGK